MTVTILITPGGYAKFSRELTDDELQKLARAYWQPTSWKGPEDRGCDSVHPEYGGITCSLKLDHPGKHYRYDLDLLYTCCGEVYDEEGVNYTW